MRKLYTIKLLQKGKKDAVYEETLPFTISEPNVEDINGFMRLIQPSLQYDTVEWIYVRELHDNEL